MTAIGLAGVIDSFMQCPTLAMFFDEMYTVILRTAALSDVLARGRRWPEDVTEQARVLSQCGFKVAAQHMPLVELEPVYRGESGPTDDLAREFRRIAAEIPGPRLPSQKWRSKHRLRLPFRRREMKSRCRPRCPLRKPKRKRRRVSSADTSSATLTGFVRTAVTRSGATLCLGCWEASQGALCGFYFCGASGGGYFVSPVPFLSWSRPAR